jgi:CRP/FNR family transcriptional regulator, nitrogen oxide reductase regulator
MPFRQILPASDYSSISTLSFHCRKPGERESQPTQNSAQYWDAWNCALTLIWHMISSVNSIVIPSTLWAKCRLEFQAIGGVRMATQPGASRTLLQKESGPSLHGASRGDSPIRPADHGTLWPRQCPLLANMPPKERQEVVRAAQIRRFSNDERIHQQGEPVQQVLLLVSGYVKLSQLGQGGNEVIVRLCGPGEVVGPLVAPTRDVAHSTTAQTLQPCEALIWPTGTFNLLSQRFPSLKLNGLSILDGHLKEMEERFREISTLEVPCRLSHQLLRLLNQIGSREGGVIQMRISQEELAQLIGSTVYTVSRVLSEWERKGIVKTRREEVSIQNANALRNLCGAVYS